MALIIMGESRQSFSKVANLRGGNSHNVRSEGEPLPGSIQMIGMYSLKYKSSHIGTKGHIAIIVNGYIASYIRLYSQIFMVTIKSLHYDYLARHI